MSWALPDETLITHTVSERGQNAVQLTADTTCETDKPRPYRIVIAVLFSAALLLSNFSGVSYSAAVEDSSATPSSTATEDTPSQSNPPPDAHSPPEPTPRATSTIQSKPSATVEETKEESTSPTPENTPNDEATPEVTDAKISVKVGGDQHGGLAGVKLRLYTGSSGPSSAVNESWATCVSDRSGICTFTVPETHDAGADYERGEQYDARYWVVQESAPAGWYANESLGLPGNSTAPYRFRTGPELRAGQHYTSGADFMTTGTSPASAGTWQNSRQNPGVSLSCRPGVDIALVLDRAGANGTAAAETMTQAIAGTHSSVTVFDADNLAQGLGQVSGSKYDLAIIVTPASADGFATTEQAIFSANALKAQGTRVVAVGIGGSNQANLRAISGPQASGSASYSGADYYTIGGGQLSRLLESITDQVACETTIDIVQKTQGYGQDSAKTAGAGWKFELETHAGTVRPATTQTTGENGKVSYSLTYNTAESDERKVALKGLMSDEQAAQGWALQQATCTINGDSVDVDGSTATLTVAPGDQVECTFVNAQTLKPNMTVEKQAWDTPNAAGLTDAQRLDSGSSLPSGHAVTWTYKVTNTGETDLRDLAVVDDQLADDAVLCPSTTLQVGKSMTCTASGTVAAGS
jgi:plastocyanin